MGNSTDVMPTVKASRRQKSETGELVLGRYRLYAPLGSGGFGSVWSGYDERLKRDVAVKIISLAKGDEARFDREAFAAARLNHPAIVQLYEAESDENGAYLVSELVEGRTLAELIAADELTDRDVVSIGKSLCAALVHAHTRDVVHRDVKPQNILVPEVQRDERFVAKLTDFGIARFLDEEAITRSGDVIGTLAYMSPEQAEGQHVTEATDVYSLALCLYEAFTGVQPVRGRNPAETARNVGEPIRPLAKVRKDLPSGLTLAVDWALSPDAAERGTLEELSEALDESCEVVSDEPSEHFESSVGLALTYPARLVSGATAGLAAAALAASAVETGPSPAVVGAVVAVSVGLLSLSFAFGYFAFRPDANFAVAAALLPLLLLTPLLLPKEGRLWPLPLVAPLLGFIGLAGAYPALFGALRVDRRAALGGLGFLAVVVAESALRTDLYLGSTAAAKADPGSLNAVLDGIAAPLFTSGVLIGAVIWALAAAVLPLIVRGKSLTLDFVAVAVWVGALVGACDSLGDFVGSPVLLQTPNGLAVGAVVGAVIALTAPRVRNSRSPALFSTEQERLA